MGEDSRTPPAAKRPATSVSSGNAPRDPQASGRVAFDVRGDAQWQWRQEDGDFRPEASTTRVQKLEAIELSLEPTMKITRLEPAPAKVELPCGGFNPYDRGALVEPKESVAPVPRTKYPPLVAPPVDDRLPTRVRRWLTSWRS
jgi:hypothetical protein